MIRDEVRINQTSLTAFDCLPGSPPVPGGGGICLHRLQRARDWVSRLCFVWTSFWKVFGDEEKQKIAHSRGKHL